MSANQSGQLNEIFSRVEEDAACHDYDAAAIAALEADLGVSLPPEFKEFLLRFGSGSYELGTIPAPDEWDDLRERYDDLGDVVDKSIIPFAEHEAGECYCFDYRVEADPRPVVVIDAGSIETWDQVAATFLHMLQITYEDDDAPATPPPAIKYAQTIEQRLIGEAGDSDAAKRTRATDKMGDMMKESYKSDALSLAFTPILLGLVADRSAAVRVNVAYALGYAKGFPDDGEDGITRKQIVDAILAMIGDKNDGVRKAAAGALGAMRAPEGIPALLAALEDPAAVNDAIWSLGRIEVYTQEIAAKLIALLVSGNDDLKMRLLETIGEIGLEKEAEIEALLPLLDSPRDLWRITLGSTLNRIAFTNPDICRFAIPSFLKAAREKHFKVRAEMVRLLAVLQVEDALPMIKAALDDPQMRSDAMFGLKRAPNLVAKLIPQLCEFIGDQGRVTFGEDHACDALANAGPKAAAAVPHLLSVLAKGTAGWDGRDVLAALAGIGTEEALAAVRKAAEAGNEHAIKLLNPSQETTEDSLPFQYPTWTAYSAVCRAAEHAFPGIEPASWGAPEWHKLPRWEYGDTFEGMDLSPIVWLERRYPAGATIAHAHVLSVALSNLYDMSMETTAAAAGDPKMPSGLGIELSIRVALREDDDLDAWMPKWVVDQLKNLVAYLQSSGKQFWYGHYSEDPDPNAHTPGLAFTFDPSFGQIRSASGTIDIIQVVRLTRDEVELCASQKTSRHFLEVFETMYPDAVNVVGRPSILDTPGTRERILAMAEAAQ